MAAGLYHTGGQGMPANGGNDIPSQNLYQDPKVDICKFGNSGQAGHTVVENHAPAGHVRERLAVPCLVLSGLVLGHAGQMLGPSHFVPGNVPCHVVPPELPVLSHVLQPGLAGPVHAVQGLVPEDAVQGLVPGLVASVGAVPSHAIPDSASSNLSDKESVLTVPSVNTVNDLNMKEVTRNRGMQQICVKEGILLSKNRLLVKRFCQFACDRQGPGII